METATRDWHDGLQAFVAQHRQVRPPATPKADPAAWSAERSLLGASLAPRLAEAEQIRAERRGLPSVDLDPIFVLTTSAPGIAAAESLLGASPEIAAIVASRIIPVTELEYRLWCIRHPDESHRHHVNLWSWVKTSVPPQRWPEFAAHPLRAGEAYWIHREGLTGGGELDRRASHLWRWDGRHASLLRAFITERAAPRLGDGRP